MAAKPLPGRGWQREVAERQLEGQKRARKINIAMFSIFFVLFAIVPTVIWWFQARSLLDLAKGIGELLVPGTGVFSVGNLFYWLPIIFMFAFGAQRAGSLAGTKVVMTAMGPQQFPPQWSAAFPQLLMWYLIWIVIPIFLIKPLIGAGLTAIINLLPPEIAIGLTQVAQTAGIDISPTIAAQEKTAEEQECKYRKLDEKGNPISGGKQISVEVVESPPITVSTKAGGKKGTVYGAEIKIKNLAKKPLNVIVTKGKPKIKGADAYYRYTSGDLKGEILGIQFAEGTYITGENSDIKKIEKKGKSNFLLTPLECLEDLGGCRILDDSEISVPLVSQEFLTDETGKVIKTTNGEPVSNLVAFDENTAATLHIEVKVRYADSEAEGVPETKGVGTGHLLIFSSKENEESIKKASDFKRTYCPTTSTGPLDVVIWPPFHTMGTGYLNIGAREGVCPEGVKEFKKEGEYCIKNVKTAKIKLINTYKDAKIKLKEIEILPARVDERTDIFPREYERFEVDNCFYSAFGEEGKFAIKFKDSQGPNNLDSISAFSADEIFKCRYRINDYPLGHPKDVEITKFKDYLFTVKVGYEYILETKKTNIPVVGKGSEEAK